ncbi:MAG: hypothetical protein V4671_01655 [Armatimonadota bacterium]
MTPRFLVRTEKHAPPGEAVRAQRADAFVDTIGVNTHFNYTNSPYATRFGEVRERLRESGIRHLRDGLFADPMAAKRMTDLHRALGVRFLQIVGPRVDSPRPWRGKLAPEKIPGELTVLKTLYGTACEAVEGPNEYDNTHVNPASPETTDPDWPATLERYTQALWRAMQADPTLRKLPVLAPSLAHASRADQCRDFSAFITFGNLHPYPGGFGPGTPESRLDSYNIARTRRVSGAKRFWASETGYHNGMKHPPHGHEPAPEAVTGKYGPRLVAEYFRRGFSRAYFYELLDAGVDPTDREANFGLLRHDLSPKPIFNALRDTIALLQDPSGTAFAPGTLSFHLSGSGDQSRIQHLLLQKRDGTFCLLLWQEVNSWDVASRKTIPVPDRPVTLTLSQPRITRAVTFLPSTHGTTPLAYYRQPATIRLTVPDQLLVIELTPEVKS